LKLEAMGISKRFVEARPSGNCRDLLKLDQVEMVEIS